MKTSRLRTKSRSLIVNELKRCISRLKTLLAAPRYEMWWFLKWKPYNPLLWSYLDRTSGRRVIEGLEAGYDATNEGVKTPLFSLVGEVIFDVTQQGKMNMLLMPSIKDLTYSDRFMDACRRRVAWCKSLIITMTAHVKRHINRIWEEKPMVQKLQQQIQETTQYSPLTTPIGGSWTSRFTPKHITCDWFGGRPSTRKYTSFWAS